MTITTSELYVEHVALLNLEKAVRHLFRSNTTSDLGYYLRPCYAMSSNHRTEECVGCAMGEVDKLRTKRIPKILSDADAWRTYADKVTFLEYVFPPKETLLAAARRPSWNEVWMALADSLAMRSTCSRLQVGCVVATADNQRVLGVGYNGGPKGISNDCLSLDPGSCGHLHAEVNALIKTDHNVGMEKKMYVTTQPCYQCSVAIVNADVREVFYKKPYRLTDGIDLLRKAGIKAVQLA